MAFNPDTFARVMVGPSQQFDYSTTESRSAVTTAGFFTGAAALGLSRGDVVRVTNSSDGDVYDVTISGIEASGGASGVVRGVTATGDQTVAGVKTFSSPVRTSANVGTAATGSTAVEYGDGMNHTTVLTVSTTLPAIAGGADLAVGKLLYTFPAGAQLVTGSRMALAITQSAGKITADTPDGGLGTTIASGAVAVLGGTAAFENILTGQTFDDCSGTVEDEIVTTTLAIYPADNHTVYFNVADGWAASGDAGAGLAGTVVLNWRTMGS